MANTLIKQDEETGGVVTTVRTETTGDLDVKKILDDQAAAQAAEDEAAKAKKDGEVEDKPGKKEAATGAAKDDKGKGKGKEDEGLDDELLDFKSLPPAQQKAVARLFKERRAEKRDMRELRSEIAALNARIAGGSNRELAPVAKPAKLTRPVRPVATDFKDEKKFNAAQDKFDDDLHAFRKQEEAEEADVYDSAAEDAKVIESFNDAAEKFAEAHDDYEDVMDTAVPLSQVMFGAVLEHGPALGYWFGKNPDEARKIIKMTPAKANIAITRIMVKIEDEEEAAKEGTEKEGAEKEGKQLTEKTKKPDPPSTVRGTMTAAPVKDRSQMTFKEKEQAYAKRNPGALNYTP